MKAKPKRMAVSRIAHYLSEAKQIEREWLALKAIGVKIDGELGTYRVCARIDVAAFAKWCCVEADRERKK